MILIAILLGALGLADLARAGKVLGRAALLLATTVGVAWLALTAWGVGVSWWWVFAGAAVVALWVWTTDAALTSRRALPWPIIGLALVLVAILAAGRDAPTPGGLAVDWYANLAIVSLESVPFELFAVGLGCVLFLLESANIVVRIVLAAAEARPVEQRTTDAPKASESDMVKGGRILGPIERLFIFTMTLAGQPLAIAAVIAAKSILRYPEVSKDSDGSKAEYVLVGS
ncbi:MAG TPA: hypothetical protein PK890_08895, partial [Terrimesophilobacter sp.]|nr:hypothetical protein [Terrimesophilobacter sp.]